MNFNQYHQPEEPVDQFEAFRATSLYCNTCKKAMPVRETLMLVLSDGDMHGYRCTGCGNYLGTRKDTKGHR